MSEGGVLMDAVMKRFSQVNGNNEHFENFVEETLSREIAKSPVNWFGNDKRIKMILPDTLFEKYGYFANPHVYNVVDRVLRRLEQNNAKLTIERLVNEVVLILKC